MSEKTKQWHLGEEEPSKTGHLVPGVWRGAARSTRLQPQACGAQRGSLWKDHVAQQYLSKGRTQESAAQVLSGSSSGSSSTWPGWWRVAAWDPWPLDGSAAQEKQGGMATILRWNLTDSHEQVHKGSPCSASFRACMEVRRCTGGCFLQVRDQALSSV